MNTIVDEIRDQLREQVCSICVHETDGGGCTLAEQMECPVFKRAARLIRIIECPEDVSHKDHVEQIRSEICVDCRQDTSGCCPLRDHLECPLDLYFPVIERVILETLARHGLRPAEIEQPENAS